MARKATPARAKEEARLGALGEVDAGGELVRDDKPTAAVETPTVRVVHAEADDAEKKRVAELDDRLADLEKELKGNARRIEDAERRAAEAEALAQRHAGAAATNQDAAFRNYETSVTNAVTAAKTELAAAKKAYAQAMEAGDFTAAADAQEAIAGAKQNEQLYAVEQRKIDDYKKNPPQRQVEQPRRQAQSPREAVDLRQMPRKARDYLDDHPDYLDDWKAWNKLSRAHADAIDDGLDPYGDEYFEFLDERMGGEKPKRRREPERRERRDTRDEGAVPPSRDNPSGNRTRADEVSLTAREVEAAHFSFPELSHHDAEVAYAEQKTKLVREDRLGTKH